MKETKAESIRNIVLLSYHGAGKTSLLEAVLAVTGAVPHMGTVADGTSVMDYEPEEHHRKISLKTSLCQIPWNDTLLNLLDTPGAPSFYAEARQATYVSDAALWVINASLGVKSESEKAWEYATSLELPGVFFVTGLDKE